MNRIAFLLGIFCFQPFLFSLPCGTFDKSYPLIEAKGGYFFFAGSEMRDVYSNGGFSVQLSGSYPVYECLQLYTSVGYLQAWGESGNGNQDTSIWEIPVDLGLKPIFNIGSFTQYYFAIGPRYFHVHQHNDSPFVDHNLSKNGVGFFVNTGFNFYPLRHLFIDIFGEYAYQHAHFSSSMPNVIGQSVQLSLFTFGAGIGYAF